MKHNTTFENQYKVLLLNLLTSNWTTSNRLAHVWWESQDHGLGYNDVLACVWLNTIQYGGVVWDIQSLCYDTV